MLLTAVSSRCFSSVNCAREARCCSLTWRMISDSRPTTSSAASAAAVIVSRVCARQSASALSIGTLATSAIGKPLIRRIEESRSRPSTGLTLIIVAGSGLAFMCASKASGLALCPTISMSCG